MSFGSHSAHGHAGRSPYPAASPSPIVCPPCAAQVYSDTAKKWLPATISVIDIGGAAVTVRYSRDGDLVEKVLPLGHSHLQLACRPVCPEGVKCRLRHKKHLGCFAHPFDLDYQRSCSHFGVHFEMPSLRDLFTWVDADSSGKISKKELQDALPLLEKLQNKLLTLTEDFWHKLDKAA